MIFSIFVLDFVPRSWRLHLIQITDLYILCKWENINNHQCIIYLFSPLYLLYHQVYKLHMNVNKLLLQTQRNTKQAVVFFFKYICLYFYSCPVQSFIFSITLYGNYELSVAIKGCINNLNVDIKNKYAVHSFSKSPSLGLFPPSLLGSQVWYVQSYWTSFQLLFQCIYWGKCSKPLK